MRDRDTWSVGAQKLLKMKIGRRLQTSPTFSQELQFSGGISRMSEANDKLIAEPDYYNPSALVWLIGHSIEATLVVDAVDMVVLVDTRSQFLSLTEGFWLEFGLKFLPLGGLLCFERTGSILTPHKGYIDASLIIPGLPPE